eukprot:131576-Chlamydomonas_euryale.AAC.2
MAGTARTALGDLGHVHTANSSHCQTGHTQPGQAPNTHRAWRLWPWTSAGSSCRRRLALGGDRWPPVA